MTKVTCEICGKEVDPRGLKMHMLSHTQKQAAAAQKLNGENNETENEPETIMSDKIQEVKLDPEEDIIKKVKDKPKEEEFNSCPDCNQTFKGFPNFCPKCGCEFE